MTGPKITIIGGGSHQWAPILIGDIANTPCLQGSEVTLHDLDPSNLPKMAGYVEHVARAKGLPLRGDYDTDLGRSVDGADFVVVCISTGGLESMGIDLSVSARHGIPMPIGDTVGPAGISRALRNIPVLVAMAQEMERRCPKAWLLNVTNPLTALTRAVARETNINVVGLCHEVTNFSFLLSQLLGCGMHEIGLTVTGVNHLPLLTQIDVQGRDGLAELRSLLDGEGLDTELPFMEEVARADYVGTGGTLHDPTAGGRWTKETVIRMQEPNFEIFRHFGALPAAGADHTVEFFAGFVTAESDWGKRHGVSLTTIEERQGREARYVAELDRRLADPDGPKFRSMEMVTPVIEALVTGDTAVHPLNIPNQGQCPDLPDGAVVESMCTVDGDGIRGRDVAVAPASLATHLRRISASQELTVDAALTGDPELVLGALLNDPLAGRCDHAVLVGLRDDLLESAARWLPQFRGRTSDLG
jgi:alpha-galactosidase